MAQLSDSIEHFIKSLMEEEPRVELQRNELAQHFGCAPSQINYVLATRFSVDHGYIIQSRRGGGGYVRIVRMCAQPEENLLGMLLERIGDSIDEESASAMIKNITMRKVVTPDEARIMLSAINRSALSLPVMAKDILRAAVLRSMLKQAFANHEERDENDV